MAARRLLASRDFSVDELAGGAAQGVRVDASGLDGGEALAEPLTLQDKVAGQHSAVHAFHHHIPHAGAHRGGSGAGIIWLLILLHLAFVAYWTWVWWTSRSSQREEKKGRSSVPQKVNCVYDWTPVMPQIPNIQLASKSAQH